MGAWVDTDDLNNTTDKAGNPRNDVHYTREGYRIFGKRLAEKAIQLIATALLPTPTIHSFVVEERLQGEAGVEQVVLEVDVTHDEKYEVQFDITKGNGIITSYGNWAIFEGTGPGQYVFEAIVTDMQGAIAKDTASYEIPYVNSSSMYFGLFTKTSGCVEMRFLRDGDHL